MPLNRIFVNAQVEEDLRVYLEATEEREKIVRITSTKKSQKRHFAIIIDERYKVSLLILLLSQCADMKVLLFLRTNPETEYFYKIMLELENNEQFQEIMTRFNNDFKE